jgi:hypothetical protein
LDTNFIKKLKKHQKTQCENYNKKIFSNFCELNFYFITFDI